MAADLEEAETLRRNLLADVSHELRHPAHLLQGNLQAIQDGVYPLEMQEIENLSVQAQHLTHLINDLHLLAQAEAQQLPLDRQPADLRTLLESAIEPYQTRAASCGVRLDFQPPTEPVMAEVDVMRLRQVIDNLLDNALRHTSPGGEVRLELQSKPGQVTLCITDTGEGIPAGQLEHVFDRFYRGDARPQSLRRQRLRAGAGHRPGLRPRPRRHDHGGVGGGSRLDFHHRPPLDFFKIRYNQPTHGVIAHHRSSARTQPGES